MATLFKPFKQAQRMAGGTGLGELHVQIVFYFAPSDLSYSSTFIDVNFFFKHNPSGLYSLAKRIEPLKGNYGVMDRRDDKEGCIFWFEIPYKADAGELGVNSLIN